MSISHRNPTPWHHHTHCRVARAIPLLQPGMAYLWQHTPEDAPQPHIYRIERDIYDAPRALDCYLLARDGVALWRSIDEAAVAAALDVLDFRPQYVVRANLWMTVRGKRLTALPWHGRARVGRLTDEQRRQNKRAANRAYNQRQRAAARGVQP
jgi:hypothetical protein